ncbi:YlbF family regulator [Paenibacillus sp. SC116]|uniref:YlbF family regulator n=1 Tax=Paenibacillus sp. SC116 TaxID=2968986 RepID=UPI00215B44F5|nr:YlbF family regulator [Paenibacillus sp. SC116]MCR8845245.1 YlbF family regulator [Paenibacillus sp. SC116]
MPHIHVSQSEYPEQGGQADTAVLLTEAYELGDMIKHSAELTSYLTWKQRMEQHEEVKQLKREFLRKKDLFEETERFGHFHPDYHSARDAVFAIEQKLDEIEEVQQFKRAEEQLDEMLYELSKVIAHSVSESIKVPSNALQPTGGCSGGGCSGGCSSCG